jgi:mRNA guanylyltransferase
MEFAYGIEDIFRIHLPNLKHGNDGLIFTALEGDYICGTDQHMYLPTPLHLEYSLMLLG